MAINAYTNDTNDSQDNKVSPNDYNTSIAAARVEKNAAEKARREAADRSAAEAKRKAEQDAQDLKSSREQVKTLEDQVRQLKQQVEQSQANTKSTIERLENEKKGKTDELQAARNELQKQNENVNRLNGEVNRLNDDVNRLNGEVNNWQQQYQREQSDPIVYSVVWGGRELVGDGNVVNRVRDRIRTGQRIQYTNDFFGCDPQRGTRKMGTIRYFRGRRGDVDAWEGEERSFP